MLPPYSFYNYGNVCLSAIKHFCQLYLAKFSRLIQFSDFKNLFFVEFCCSLSALNGSVHSIVGGRPEEKMVWPNTAGIITDVTDMKSKRDFSVVYLPRDSMRGMGTAANAETTISVCGSGDPFPARVKRDHFYLVPESIYGGI